MPTTYRLEFVSEVNAPLDRVWQFHDRIEGLFELAPPGARIELEGDPEPMREGVLYRLKITRYGLPLRWDARIVEYVPPYRFVDRAERSPFLFWEHQHVFEPISESVTRLIDTVTYQLPFGWLGRLANPIVVWDVRKMFTYRHHVVKQRLEERG
ncbi:MAG: SRPBCC family protein [Fimbriimonadia bacterium]|nr:SRPBCC family protein [Fimbriimonadia bacterium]